MQAFRGLLKNKVIVRANRSESYWCFMYFREKNAGRTHDRTSTGNADGNHDHDMDSTTVEGRDEPGRTTSSLDTTTRGKTRRHSGSNTSATRSVIPEQKPVRHKAPTTTAED